MGIIITIIKTLVLLGVLVIIHEGGHFVVAKLCKIKVNEFSVGFGTKKRYKIFHTNDSTWRICKYGRRRRTFR